jgi:hypothetical protein
VALGTGLQPAVASDGAGALVVWAELVSGQYDVRGALVARDGSTSGAFTVFAAAGEQVLPAVAFDGESYVVAWRRTPSGPGPSTDTQVSAARVSPAGEVLDPQGIAIATGPGIADGPAVASDGSASVVVWADSSTAPYATIRAARIARDGTLLDGPPSGGGVAVAEGASYGAPAVALVGADYLVAWTDASFEPDAGIYTARLSPQGALLDPVPVHAAWPFWDGRAYGSPAIASDGEGALVAFMQSFNDKDIEGAFVYPRADR